MNKLCLFLLLIWLILPLSRASSVNEGVSLAVTVYNDEFAIVKDVRSMVFDEGRSDLYFTDVSSNIHTETVTFKALANPQAIRVFEQNYQANLINTYDILKKYINRNISIYAKVGGESIRVNGTLLGFRNGYILQTNSGIEVYNNIEGINFSSLPDGFLTLPTLHWKVYSQAPLTTNCEVAYRTTGFSWKADYSVTLSGDERKADLGGWVTIVNRSGKKYQNAKLKLIAGDVNTVDSQWKDELVIVDEVRAAPSFAEKSFSDFHLYTLSDPTTLEENSQKQIQFIPKVYDIAIRKYNYIKVYAGDHSEENLKASNKVEISNNHQNKLGIALPKGTVRVFKADDADGSLEFLGEDSIDHTPKDENLTVTTGNAFDITANKIVTNYRSYSNASYSADINLTIWNHKGVPAEIVVEIQDHYGDNNQLTWRTEGLSIQKVSARVLRISRVFSANEQYSYIWSEKYRP